jgi:hypothetical protein
MCSLLSQGPGRNLQPIQSAVLDSFSCEEAPSSSFQFNDNSNLQNCSLLSHLLTLLDSAWRTSIIIFPCNSLSSTSTKPTNSNRHSNQQSHQKKLPRSQVQNKKRHPRLFRLLPRLLCSIATYIARHPLASSSMNCKKYGSSQPLKLPKPW